MKLNTLLLTSAATLMATSVAFAADLPSKKAAPAAGSVQICKVGGMNGWTLPGSDTCFAISGFARFDTEYDLNSNSDDGIHDFTEWQGEARVTFDARSNTEIGVVRGVVQLGAEPGLSLRRAYVQFAGLTAGRKDSIADVYGTQSIHFTNADQSNEGIDYQINVGGLNFGLGLEGPNDDNVASRASDTPDIVAHLSGSAGPVGFAVAAASHEANRANGQTASGYAVMGNVNATMSGLRLGIFGGMAQNAQVYTGAHTLLDDFQGGLDVDSTIAGLSLLYSVGKVSLWAEVAQYNHQWSVIDANTDAVAVGASFQLAKNLTLSGEYWNQDEDLVGKSETVQIRIQRDF